LGAEEWGRFFSATLLGVAISEKSKPDRLPAATAREKRIALSTRNNIIVFIYWI